MKTNLEIARECGATILPNAYAQRTIAVFDASQLDAFVERIRESKDTPAERKPLTDDQISENNVFTQEGMHRQAFHAGARFAEKHHGITGEPS